MSPRTLAWATDDRDWREHQRRAHIRILDAQYQLPARIPAHEQVER